MNPTSLRQLVRKHGNLGYVMAGGYMLGHHLFKTNRKQTLAVLAIALAGSACAARIYCHTGPELSDVQFRCALPAVTAAVTPSDTVFTITDLGVASGYDYSIATGVSNKGQATGVIFDEAGEKLHGFSWSNGRMSDIGTLGGSLSIAAGVNDGGQIAGTSLTRNDEEARGFVWQNGKMQPIGTLGGQASIAQAINNTGQVVGFGDTSRGALHAFLWQNGKTADIGSKCPGVANIAMAINNDGAVAGIFTPDGESTRSFVLSGNRAKELPSLGGDNSIAIGMSSKQIVGFSEIKPGNQEVIHGCVWQPGGVQDIGTLGGQVSLCLDTNNNGVVIGLAETREGEINSFIWANGKMVDLKKMLPTDSGWDYILATAINDKNQIIATGIRGDETVHALLLTPKKSDSASLDLSSVSNVPAARQTSRSYFTRNDFRIGHGTTAAIAENAFLKAQMVNKFAPLAPIRNYFNPFARSAKE